MIQKLITACTLLRQTALCKNFFSHFFFVPSISWWWFTRKHSASLCAVILLWYFRMTQKGNMEDDQVDVHIPSKTTSTQRFVPMRDQFSRSTVSKNDFSCIFFHPEAGKLVINLPLTKRNLKEFRRKQSLKIIRKVVRHNRSTRTRKINQQQLLSEYLRH